ncbi:putative calcium-binding protein CML27 [Drosera capensis]
MAEGNDHLRGVFARFDANGDNHISVNEMCDALSYLGYHTTIQEVECIIDEMDTNHDKQVNFDEFVEFCKKKKFDDEEEVILKEVFNRYDKDNNGVISADELFQVMSEIDKSCTRAGCERTIQKYDSDGDGNISFDEFKKMIKEMKDRLNL